MSELNLEIQLIFQLDRVNPVDTNFMSYIELKTVQF